MEILSTLVNQCGLCCASIVLNVVEFYYSIRVLLNVLEFVLNVLDLFYCCKFFLV